MLNTANRCFMVIEGGKDLEGTKLRMEDGGLRERVGFKQQGNIVCRFKRCIQLLQERYYVDSTECFLDQS